MTTPRKIFITGCSRGLGLALVNAFINAGHTLAGCSRSQPKMAELAAKQDNHHLFQAVDISDPDAVKAWVSQSVAHIGVPDLVINNAAVINKPAPLWQVSAQEFQQLVAINIAGVHLVSLNVLPLMIEQGHGVLVNLSSGWGRSVAPDVAPYCASKWAIEGMTKALAEELPAGLAAIPLSPGVIDTPMLRETWGEGAAGYRSPDVWASTAAPYILSLNASHSGRSLTTPG